MAGDPNRTLLPIIALAREAVLFPGITFRIPVQNRPDIPSLLSAIYAKAAVPKSESSPVAVGCVPLCSPLLSPEGQNLLEDSDVRMRKTAEHLMGNPGGAGERDLFGYGVVARISGVQGRRPQELALVVEGVRRFRVERFTQFKPFIECEVMPLGEEGTYHAGGHGTLLIWAVIDSADTETQALFHQFKQSSQELLTLVRLSSMLPGSTPTLSPLLARRLKIFISEKSFEEAGVLADFIANVVEATFEEKLQVLAALDIKERLERVIEILSRQINGIKGNVRVTTFTSTTLPTALDIISLPQKQTDALMRQGIGNLAGGPFQLGTPGRGDKNGAEDEVDEIDELRQKLKEAKLTPEAQKVADKELKRLRKMNAAQAEYGVCRSYLENLAEVPWTALTEDQLGTDTLKRARKQLDDDHYGLDKIKKRLLEYLAVLRLKQRINADLEADIKKAIEESASRGDEGASDASGTTPDAQEAKIQILKSKRMVDKSPILLLVGPPGTGKTSLAKSVATALGRKFQRISLGGVRDEAEIRGHRRTYVAAMPGLIVNGLKKAGVSNPVFLLDEIDKVGGANFHGDPSAAMLEVLDPEQNRTFMDHYINIPIDLSKVLFIATANSVDYMPAPLLDRMETISLSGYTDIEKRHIAMRHLVPKQVLANGLSSPDIQLSDSVIDTIITSYTFEAGVRSLEREIGSVCRYKAVEYSDAKDSPDPHTYSSTVSVSDLETILGKPRYDEELTEKTAVPGVVTGLVAFSSAAQGSICTIEVADMPGGAGRVQLTGTLGDVLKESVEVALTWVKAHAFELGLARDQDVDIMAQRSVHVHCPAGATPKDGPSAGLAHTVALVSLFAGRTVPTTMAMTGEVSLRGRVLPVGGIKEKLIGALRTGIKTVLLPKRNAKDVAEVPQEVKDGLEIITVAWIYEALKLVWPDTRWGEDLMVESRL